MLCSQLGDVYAYYFNGLDAVILKYVDINLDKFHSVKFLRRRVSGELSVSSLLKYQCNKYKNYDAVVAKLNCIYNLYRNKSVLPPNCSVKDFWKYIEELIHGHFESVQSN